MKRIGILIANLGLLLLVQAAQADWTPAKRLTSLPGSSQVPAVAIDSDDHIHVIWADNTPGNREIYYKRSTDAGTTWSTAKRLTWTPGFSYFPAIAIDSGNAIHIVWYDDTPGNYQIYYKKSTDGGTTWNAIKRLTWNSGMSCDPTIATDSTDGIHIAWYDYPPYSDAEIYYKSSTDAGTTWSTAKRLTWTTGESLSPAIAIDSTGIIYVAWSDLITESFVDQTEIYGSRSTDGGMTWSGAQRLTWTSGYTYYPAIAAGSGSHFHIICTDRTPGNYELYHKRSMDGGIAWNAPKRLTWTPGSSDLPAVAIDSDDHIHVIWPDDTPGYHEIYYKQSTDEGTTWNTMNRLTWTPGSSYLPAVAIDSSGAIHVVWQDNTPGNYEIYYKKGK